MEQFKLFAIRNISMMNIIEGIKETGKIADNLHYSGDERDTHISKRHEADMKSDSRLSKNIRPMTLVYLLTANTGVIVADLVGVEVSEWIIGQLGTLLLAAFGFYFNSKKAERVAEKNAVGNMKIKRMQIEHEQRMEDKKQKEIRKDNRISRRALRRNNK